jgi:hypothetical protein
MPAVIMRLLSLLALLAMPFGMGMASAAPQQPAPAAASAEHCGQHGRQPADTSAEHSADCTMGCSMLVAAEPQVADPAPRARLPAQPAHTERGVGLHPETETPPPKLS